MKRFLDDLFLLFKGPTKMKHALLTYLLTYKSPSNYNKINIKGMFTCGRVCPTCPYIREGKSIKVNNKDGKMTRKYDCNTFNVIYAKSCKKNARRHT